MPKSFEIQHRYKDCCEEHLSIILDKQEYVDDTIVAPAFCQECGAEYTVCYDLRYIEHSGTKQPVLNLDEKAEDVRGTGWV